MINTLTRAATLGALMTTVIFATTAPALSQAPTQAQRDAIKSECRSDYMAHCSSIPPGGEASLLISQGLAAGRTAPETRMTFTKFSGGTGFPAKRLSIASCPACVIASEKGP